MSQRQIGGIALITAAFSLAGLLFALFLPVDEDCGTVLSPADFPGDVLSNFSGGLRFYERCGSALSLRGAIVWVLGILCAAAFIVAVLRLIQAPANEISGTLSNVGPDLGSSRRCPYCAETIQMEARFCKHCKREIDVG